MTDLLDEQQDQQSRERAQRYLVDKGFCFSKVLGTKIKGQTVLLKGDELMFALENKCVTRVKNR